MEVAPMSTPAARGRARRTMTASGLLVLLQLSAIQIGQAAAPTVEEAREFLQRTERKLMDLDIAASRASWVQSTYITQDTELIAAEAEKNLLAAQMEAAKEAARFRDLKLPDDLAREIQLLRTSLSLAAPSDPAKQTELAQIGAEMEGA